MPNDIKYIEKLLEIIESDKKMVFLYITFSLAILVISIQEIVLSENNLFQDQGTSQTIINILFTLCMVLFLLSALFHYLYYRRLHLNLYAIAKCLLNEDSEQARELFFGNKGIWKQHGWKFNLGLFLFWTSLVLYTIFLMLIVF